MASRGGTIGERFEWVQTILQPFKQALTGSKFEFVGIIRNEWAFKDDKGVFKDPSMLLNHIDKLLQIFNQYSPHTYKPYIESCINENPSTNILSAILHFDAIVRCSKIRVLFNYGDSMQMTRLPIEAIGNLLNRNNANGQERFLTQERFLLSRSSLWYMSPVIVWYMFHHDHQYGTWANLGCAQIPSHYRNFH